ncbi:MAG: histidinol-phosphatase [Mogibacterium sp.]|nr:histidinol-phosphatase [Mogibacterium sp.]
MIWNRNYHTHSTYCDGFSRPEESVRRALELGFCSLGFSGHSHTAFDEGYCMSRETAAIYREEIGRLREQYADRIEILCGLEYDYYSDETLSGWDYLIGSVHYLRKDGEYLPVDESAEITIANIRDYYGGDIYAYAEDYFETIAKVCEKIHCDIIGHFDLVAKFNSSPEMAAAGMVIDEDHPRYVAAWMQAVERLIPYDAAFEINTSAWYRGKKDPYPSAAILREILRRGGRITISSDSHEAGTLNRGFDRAVALAREIGFTSLTAMSAAGPVEVAVE